MSGNDQDRAAGDVGPDTADAGEAVWLPEERAALDALPRELWPAGALEERTVGALRARGFLGRGRSAGARAGWWVAAAAAAVALFLGGVQVGQLQGTRRTVETLAAVGAGGTLDAAVEVQRTAAAYLAAVALLADRMESGDSVAVAQAREVVGSALAASALETLRVTPDDRLAAAIRAVAAQEVPAQGPARQVLWF